MECFKGKNVLVSGSTRGIGKAIASGLVSAGALVGINGRDPEKVKAVCTELGSDSTVPLPKDLYAMDAGAALVADFVSKAGSIDGLVNNAGAGKAAPFRAMTTARWQETFTLNLESAMTAAREAYNVMRKKGAGSILNIASISGHGPGKWMGADYAASKAGLINMTKSLAFEAGRYGIRVNAVSPGFVETDMTEVITDEMRASLPIPMKRFGAPAEIANAVIWLLSEEAAYITGQVIHVDGGLYM